MYLLADVAQPAGEHELDLRMYIFDPVFDDELSRLGHGVDAAQFGGECIEFVAGEEPDAFEHRDVGYGAEYVVGCEVEIHFTVAPHGEPVDVGIDLNVLFPKFLCHVVGCF